MGYDTFQTPGGRQPYTSYISCRGSGDSPTVDHVTERRRSLLVFVSAPVVVGVQDVGTLPRVQFLLGFVFVSRTVPPDLGVLTTVVRRNTPRTPSSGPSVRWTGLEALWVHVSHTAPRHTPTRPRLCMDGTRPRDEVILRPSTRFKT